MDKYILRQIRRTVGKSGALDRFFTHVAKRGPLWFFLVFGCVLLFGGTPGLRAVVAAVVSAVITRGCNELLGRLYHRPRPFVQEGFTPLLAHDPSSSFPSNHAACGFALAVAVYVTMPAVGGLLLLFALLLAFSRLFVGVHYPLDVLVGALLGSAIAKAVVWVLAFVW